MRKNPIKGRYSRLVRHGDADSRDLCLCTRKPTRVVLDELSVHWGGAGDGQEHLALFLLYNKHSFAFLSIDARLSEDGTPALIFLPSEKVGCAPLYSPVNGKVCASIIVRGNMNEDISEILPLIEGDIDVDFSDKLVLPFKSTLKPPLYFECAKYLDQYIKAQRLHWRKFVSEVRIEHEPASSTQWAKYAAKSYDPGETFKYPNKKNILSVNHQEWQELNYVLKICLDELCSPDTPRVSKQAYRTKVEDLRRKTDFRDITKPIELKIHSADPKEIKELKIIGNRVISSVTSEYRAWSLDFSRLFECYVQYVFSQLAKMIGARTLSNSRFAISGSYREWGLAYLEPDIIITKGDKMIVADAKYKMHMYNLKAGKADALKESFRSDLHQVLAYSSFERDNEKTAILAYPCSTFKCIHQRIFAQVSSCVSNVYLIGVPWGNGVAEEGSATVSIQEKVKMAINGLYDNVFKDI